MSWLEVQQELNKLQQKKANEQQGKDLGFVEGAFDSFVYTFPEMIGVQAPENVQRFREENPGTAFVTEMAGWLLPIGAAGKLSNKVIKGIVGAVETKAPKVAKTIESLAAGEKIVEAPFKAGMAKEIIRFAPYEAARTTAGAVFGDQVAESLDTNYIGTGNLIMQAGTELGLFGLGNGIFETFASAGRKLRKEIKPGADVSQPLQIQMRQMEQYLANGQVVDVDAAKAVIAEMARDVRQASPRKGKFAEELQLGSAKEINRFTKLRKSEQVDKLMFSHSVSGNTFKTLEERKAVEELAGLPQGYEAYVQFPRYVEGKTKDYIRHVDRTFQKNMYPLDTSAGWFFNLDKADGLYLMGKKLDKGKWVIFKTDTPGKFVPAYAKYAESLQARSAIFRKDLKKYTPLGEGAETWDLGLKLKDDIPAVDLRGTDLRKGNIAKTTESLYRATGLDKIADKGSASFQGIANFTKKYLAPTMFQFDHPLAIKSFAIARSMADNANGIAEKLFVGKRALQKETSLYKDIYKGAEALGGESGIKSLISTLHKNPEQWEAVWRTVNRQASIEEGIATHGLGPEGVTFLKELAKIDAWQIEGLNKVQAAAGEKLIEAKANHFMISRTWKGDWRVPVMNGKRVIGYASGEKRAEALAEAGAIVGEAAKDGVKLKVGDPSLVGELRQDLINLRKIDLQSAADFGKYKDAAWVKKTAPARATEKRKGLGGYVGAIRPWTQEELEKIIFKQLNDYQRYQAKLSTNTLLKSELEQLRLTEPDVYEQLVNRINQIYGVQGKVSEAINKATDVILSPVLGKNSASKITAAANKYMFRWTLGFVNTGYLMAQMLTFVQTAYPHIAFLATAAPESVSKYYSYWPVAGMHKVDAIGQLDMLKITAQTFINMRKPDLLLKKMVERGANEGVWDPRFVEEFVGQKTTQAKLSHVFSGEEPFSKWVGAVVDAPAAFVEKFSRMQAMTMGYTVFKDVFRVQDEELLYQMAKQFTEKTQFMYSSADRANIITGPLGSSFGLFKNWVMHYIGWMMEYTGEGVMRGNWGPLLYMMGSTTAIGGIGALPLYGAADMMSQWLSDKHLMVNAYDAFGGKDGDLGTVADAAFYGLPAMLGFSIQNQVSAPGVDMAQDASRLFSFAYLDRMKYASQAFGQAIDSWGATGQHPIQDQRTRDLMMRAFAPKMIYRISQAIQDNALKSLSTGYPVTDLDLAGRIMYASGVNPLDIEKTYAASRELWADQDKMKAAVQKYGKAWAEAAAAGDNEVLKRIINRALLEGVDIGKVIKSAKARLAKGQEDMINRQFSPEGIFAYQKAGIVK